MKIITTEVANWQIDKCLHQTTGRAIEIFKHGQSFHVSEVITLLTEFAVKSKHEIYNNANEVKTSVL